MNSEIIILIPAFLCAWVAMRDSAQRALIAVYLPVLLLLPDYFHLSIDGLPDPTFSECTILPIGFAMCWNIILKRAWKFSPPDLLVGSYVLWAFLSDWHNIKFKDAVNQSFDLVTMAVFPYMAGKMLIEPFGLRGTFARRFVGSAFVVAVLSFYEFRMMESLFRPTLGMFFPNQKPGWATQIRWGFGRVAGPYGHAILMGGVMAIALLLHRWLTRAHQWEPGLGGLHLPASKSTILLFVLGLGSIMTFSRGPWMGLLCGLAFASIGVSSNPGRRLRLVVLLLALAGTFIYMGGKAYIAGVNPATTDHAEEQGSAAYRAILIDEYVDIALHRSVWGWGRGHWPIMGGMISIDNHYLLLTLEQGLIGLGIFLAILVTACSRLLRKALSSSTDSPERLFVSTMLGIQISIAVSIGTVFLGAQLYPLFFLCVGWTEGLLVWGRKSEIVFAPVVRGFQFRGVLA